MGSTSHGYGKLILFEHVAGGKPSSPRTWSCRRTGSRPLVPDSRHFIFARAGELLYYSLDQHEGKRILDEFLPAHRPRTHRKRPMKEQGSSTYFGTGACTRHPPSGVFRAGLYAGGRLHRENHGGEDPFSYTNFDSFRVSPEGTKSSCAKTRNLFLVYLDRRLRQANRVTALPYLFLQGNTTVSNVLWRRARRSPFSRPPAKWSRVAGVYRITAPATPRISR